MRTEGFAPLFRTFGVTVYSYLPLGSAGGLGSIPSST
jgi:hypothetical protein